VPLSRDLFCGVGCYHLPTCLHACQDVVITMQRRGEKRVTGSRQAHDFTFPHRTLLALLRKVARQVKRKGLLL